jgi:hypothetical protein
LREHYRGYIKRLRSMAVTLTRDELAMAVEYHLLAWRVLRNEYNGR